MNLTLAICICPVSVVVLIRERLFEEYLVATIDVVFLAEHFSITNTSLTSEKEAILIIVTVDLLLEDVFWHIDNVYPTAHPITVGMGWVRFTPIDETWLRSQIGPEGI